MVVHECERVGERRIGMNRDRVHHHAGLEFLHPPHVLGLSLGLKVAVDHADAAGLRHGDGEAGLRHRIHGGRDDRQVERNRARQPRAHIDLGRKHVREPRLQQYVVEGERFLREAVGETGHRQLLSGLWPELVREAKESPPRRVGEGG